jgi:hypothetical protein
MVLPRRRLISLVNSTSNDFGARHFHLICMEAVSLTLRTGTVKLHIGAAFLLQQKITFFI